MAACWSAICDKDITGRVVALNTIKHMSLKKWKAGAFTEMSIKVYCLYKNLSRTARQCLYSQQT